MEPTPTNRGAPLRRFVQALLFYAATALLGWSTYEAVSSLPHMNAAIAEFRYFAEAGAGAVFRLASTLTFVLLAVPVRFVLGRVTFTLNRVTVIALLVATVAATVWGPMTFLILSILIMDSVTDAMVSNWLPAAAYFGMLLGLSFICFPVAALGVAVLALVDRLLRALTIGPMQEGATP